MDALQPIGAILLVLGLLAGALFVLKKNRVGGLASDLRLGSGGRRLQVIERVSLTPQHTLSLVRVGARMMMVATAPGNCQILDAPEGQTVERAVT